VWGLMLLSRPVLGPAPTFIAFSSSDDNPAPAPVHNSAPTAVGHTVLAPENDHVPVPVDESALGPVDNPVPAPIVPPLGYRLMANRIPTSWFPTLSACHALTY